MYKKQTEHYPYPLCTQLNIFRLKPEKDFSTAERICFSSAEGCFGCFSEILSLKAIVGDSVVGHPSLGQLVLPTQEMSALGMWLIKLSKSDTCHSPTAGQQTMHGKLDHGGQHTGETQKQIRCRCCVDVIERSITARWEKQKGPFVKPCETKRNHRC